MDRAQRVDIRQAIRVILVGQGPALAWKCHACSGCHSRTSGLFSRRSQARRTGRAFSAVLLGRYFALLLAWISVVSSAALPVAGTSSSRVADGASQHGLSNTPGPRSGAG